MEATEGEQVNPLLSKSKVDQALPHPEFFGIVRRVALTGGCFGSRGAMAEPKCSGSKSKARHSQLHG